jgi:hypothetical protein
MRSPFSCGCRREQLFPCWSAPESRYDDLVPPAASNPEDATILINAAAAGVRAGHTRRRDRFRRARSIRMRRMASAAAA